MKTIYFLSILTFFNFICTAQSQSSRPGIHSDETLFMAMETNTQWPSYRGMFACGYMHDTGIPDSFNVETGWNIQWNVPVPGLGLSCPVMWDDMVFITTAISESDNSGYLTGMYGDIKPVNDTSIHTWKLYNIDKVSGNITWERTLHKGKPAVKRHPKSSHANTTVATDGKHVVVFLGTEGLYCYNTSGDLLWKRDFGLIMSAWHVVKSAEWEFCSSPVIFENRLILQVDALNQAFVAVLDLETGKTIWKKERDEIPTWCTPNIYFENEKARVVLNGYKQRAAYDLENGELIWQMDGGGDIPIPTPLVWKDLIYFNSAHGRHAPLMAINNSVKGEIAYPKKEDEPGKGIAWFYDRGGAYMSSVLVYDSLLYRIRWNGNLACYNPRNGELYYEETVHPYSFIASPVATDGRVILVAENGDVYIIKAGKNFELLNTLPLGETSLVTPGITKGMIIFRTATRLIAVGSGSS